MSERMIYTDEPMPLKKALEYMTDEWIDSDSYCTQTVTDLRDALRELLHGEGEKGYCVCGKPEGHKEPCPPDGERDKDGDSMELAYAKRLATAIWEKHWKQYAPEWGPFDNLYGVLSQIDNMTCGMARVDDDQPSPAPNREEWKLWIQDLPRPADDWSDMNAWLDAVEIWLEHGPWMRGK